MRANASLWLSLLVLVISAAAVLMAMAWPWKAALFPLVIGIPLFLLALAEFGVTLAGRAPADDAAVMDFAPSQDIDPGLARRRTLAAFGWLIGFTLLIVGLGFSLAIPIFVLLYLRIEAREGWVWSSILALVAWASVYGLFVRLLNVPFPDGWVQTGLRALGVLK